ncbi:26117_t:CDS:1, partial [Gigaspora rosea]
LLVWTGNMENMDRLRPPYPPTIVARDLAAVINERSVGLKAFHAYRIYCNSIASSQNVILPNNMLSIIASKFWAREPKHVKEMYQYLAAEALALFRYIVMKY